MVVEEEEGFQMEEVVVVHSVLLLVEEVQILRVD